MLVYNSKITKKILENTHTNDSEMNKNYEREKKTRSSCILDNVILEPDKGVDVVSLTDYKNSVQENCMHAMPKNINVLP